MARSTESGLTSSTKEDSHGAAPHALPVNKIVAVLLANFLSVTHFHNRTFLAMEVLCLVRVLRFHCLSTVLHATEVWLQALGALIECALMQGELGQFSIINVTFCYHSSLLVKAFLNCDLLAELEDLFL
jgi:hypothetical protein